MEIIYSYCIETVIVSTIRLVNVTITEDDQNCNKQMTVGHWVSTVLSANPSTRNLKYLHFCIFKKTLFRGKQCILINLLINSTDLDFTPRLGTSTWKNSK